MNNTTPARLEPLASGAGEVYTDRGRLQGLLAEDSPRNLYRVGQLADSMRRARYGLRTTYIDNLHINHTNICVRDCKFCDFAAKPGESHGYNLDEAGILASVRRHKPREVHIVGGLNHEWGYTRSLEMIRALRGTFPDLYIKCFTAVEMHWFARTGKKPLESVLESFVEAGMNGMPGGGAEIFSERIRQRYFRHKLGAEDWLDVHERAHRLGIPTNATMLFGFGESLSERMEHLSRLHELQERTGGFVAFIPLAMQYGKNSGKIISPFENLKMIAVSRLMLDNFPHIKAYWPMIGRQTAAAALSWGADDLDGTIGTEKIAHAAGASTPKQLARDDMRTLIRLAGFQAVERDGAYRPITR